MVNIKISTGTQTKPMKPMHGGGQPPLVLNSFDKHFHYMTEAAARCKDIH